MSPPTFPLFFGETESLDHRHEYESVSIGEKRHRTLSEDEDELFQPNTKKQKDRHEEESVYSGLKRPRLSLTDDELDQSPKFAKKQKTAHLDEPTDPALLASSLGTDAESTNEANNGRKKEGEDTNPETPAKSSTTKKTAKTNVRIVKNDVRNTDENGLEVRIEGDWVPAIEHPDYVNRLPSASIDSAQYIHKRASGTGDRNRTAYLASQHGWGEDRGDRPDILFAYKVPQTGWNSSRPSFLVYRENGVERIVIDVINHRPLKAFANLPVTISDKVEGWLMEAWSRQDRNIDSEDLIQRMPFAATDKVWDNKKFSNALTQRRERFRNRGRCLSWKKVKHDRQWDRQLNAEMEANAAWLNANTTRYLNDLTIAEDRALEAATYMSAKYKKRAEAGPSFDCNSAVSAQFESTKETNKPAIAASDALEADPTHGVVRQYIDPALEGPQRYQRSSAMSPRRFSSPLETTTSVYPGLDALDRQETGSPPPGPHEISNSFGLTTLDMAILAEYERRAIAAGVLPERYQPGSPISPAQPPPVNFDVAAGEFLQSLFSANASPGPFPGTADDPVLSLSTDFEAGSYCDEDQSPDAYLGLSSEEIDRQLQEELEEILSRRFPEAEAEINDPAWLHEGFTTQVQ